MAILICVCLTLKRRTWISSPEQFAMWTHYFMHSTC